MKLVVSIADMKLSGDESTLIITYGLGSCLGITVHDPVAKIGGMVHVMMPTSTVNPAKAQANPFMFMDTGVPAFLQEMEAAGASRHRWVVKAAGGASTVNDHFAIGKRNCVTLRKVLWRCGILIDAQDIGGSEARTMSLEIATGKVWLSHRGQRRELTPGGAADRGERHNEHAAGSDLQVSSRAALQEN